MSAATLSLAGVEPVPPQRVPRRVWLDLEVPVDVDLAEQLAGALWFQLTIAPADPAQLQAGFEGVGYYVEVSCRVCGCTDSNACPPGCHWVAPDLCSECGDGYLDEAFAELSTVTTVRVVGDRL